VNSGKLLAVQYMNNVTAQSSEWKKCLTV